LVEAYGYLKGPADMLQLYEQKYKQEVERFEAELEITKQKHANLSIALLKVSSSVLL
jgi:hypothetical protein